MRILVVEDEPLIAKSLSIGLEGEGVNADVADRGDHPSPGSDAHDRPVDREPGARRGLRVQPAYRTQTIFSEIFRVNDRSMVLFLNHLH